MTGADGHGITDWSGLLDEVRLIAREAGGIVMEVYADTSVTGTDKADGSPVTIADQRAETHITKRLREVAPAIPVIGEEAAAAGALPALTGGAFWLVDPLDGTKHFLKRDGEFTVNIALMERGVPVMGVVLAPAFNEEYAALSMDGEAFAVTLDENGNDAPIKTRGCPDVGLTVLASRSHRNQAALDAFTKDLLVETFRSRGSSLKFCEVARGSADVYPRFGPTSEWDTAAGHAVLRAAGGDVVSPDGNPFPYGKAGQKFLNGPFIAWGQLPMSHEAGRAGMAAA